MKLTDLSRLCDGPDVGRDVIHTWTRTGLDVVGGQLCTTRRCLRCGVAEYKPYGGKGAWKR